MTLQKDRNYLKIIICSLILLISGLVFADNARVSELQEEAKQLIDKKTEYVQVVNQIDMRLLEIQGALKEYKLIEDKQEEV